MDGEYVPLPTGLTMKGSGSMIRCTGKESMFDQMGLRTKDIGQIIFRTDSVDFAYQMAMFMKGISAMARWMAMVHRIG